MSTIAVNRSGQFLEHMLNEFDDAKKYYKCSIDESADEYKELYKELSLNEIADIEKLNKVFRKYCDKSDLDNIWYKHFITEVDDLRDNINKL